MGAYSSLGRSTVKSSETLPLRAMPRCEILVPSHPVRCVLLLLLRSFRCSQCPEDDGLDPIITDAMPYF